MEGGSTAQASPRKASSQPVRNITKAQQGLSRDDFISPLNQPEGKAGSRLQDKRTIHFAREMDVDTPDNEVPISPLRTQNQLCDIIFHNGLKTALKVLETSKSEINSLPRNRADELACPLACLSTERMTKTWMTELWHRTSSEH